MMQSQWEHVLHLKFSRNQWQNIHRLIHEICRREPTESPDSLCNWLQAAGLPPHSRGKDLFRHIQYLLIQRRYPETSRIQRLDQSAIFHSELPTALSGPLRPETPFIPHRLIIEQAVADRPLTKRLQQLFPHAPCEYVEQYGEYVKRHRFCLTDLKTPSIFLVQERWDFIRPCPCTKNHIGCGYWIFNLGFGCPFDCSYCFLQQYSNVAGIILPANLEDFFRNFSDWFSRVNRPIRIGTGEFCDSLALDHLTGYSRDLVNFFRDKPVLFELKTKSDAIDNLLNIPAAANTVISWSLNPPSIIAQEEYASASLSQRLRAAERLRAHGYGLAFHFDPIFWFPGWEKEYQNVIEQLYATFSGPFHWISLGTLRGTRQLKSVAEQRFPDSSVFYGELFLGKDKKLRYPDFMRSKIYSAMKRMIRAHDRHTPLYLCMETAEQWQTFDRAGTDTSAVERYLLGN